MVIGDVKMTCLIRDITYTPHGDVINEYGAMVE
jgi:hypothetical protein